MVFQAVDEGFWCQLADANPMNGSKQREPEQPARTTTKQLLYYALKIIHIVNQQKTDVLENNTNSFTCRPNKLQLFLLCDLRFLEIF